MALNSWMKRGIYAAVLLLVLGFCSMILLPVGLMSPMAFALRPAEYPGSQLVSTFASGGPDSQWDRRSYKTADPLSSVLAYYERAMPGFQQQSTVSTSVRYINSRCDESWLSRQIARGINEGRYPWYTADNVPLPCVSVTIYQSAKNSGETDYDIWVDWPAP